jgi:thioesterase domain-containing protein/acyl carrier protein
MQWFVDEACRSEDARVPIGFPLRGNRVAIIDTDGRSVRPGEAGELVVASPHVALGLWSDGRCVADAFEPSGSGRIFRTGDIVRQRADGLLERLGRKDRQVKIRGVRVELDGVEAVLRRHRFVRDVGVLARRTGDDGEAVLVAYVNAHDDAPAGLLDELKEMTASLPQAMRPSRIYRALRIPRLESSKLDMRALAALDDANAEAERTARGLGGADDMARTVAHVWQKILDRHVVAPTDDFFEAGGDSLRAITFVMELEQALGLELSLTLINEAPQFAQLCEVLRERRTDSLRLVSLKAGEGAPPLYFIHGLGGSVVDLFPVARSLVCPGAVVGVQARGLAGGEKPHASVEAMAVEYLRAIKARQPEGPYHLCGYSFGGLVAFEMARRLRQAGDEVGLVGLFDTTPGAIHWPASVWLDLVRRRLARVPALAVGAWTGMSNLVKRIAEKLKGRDAPRQADRLPSFLKSAPARVLATATAALVASARYRPGFYPGEVKLFIPDERDPALPTPQAIWRRHARSLSVVHVAGDHLTMMSARNAQAMAKALRLSLPAQ